MSSVAPRRRRRLVTGLLSGIAALAVAGALGLPSGFGLTATTTAPLPAGTFCQGPRPTQPQAGPQKVILIDLENETSSSISDSPDAPFQNRTLSGQCGSFASTAMHSTTHGSEGNYLAQTAGINPATDAIGRFALSDCPPDNTSPVCVYGGGHFSSSVPSIFSQLNSLYGTTGWKTYSDDMPSNCLKYDAVPYAVASGQKYRKYAARHNPATFFEGVGCQSQDVPSGDWQNGQGALYNDLMTGDLPSFSFIQPNDIENGHDPVSVKGVTVAGGTSQIGNADNYISKVMALISSSPDYQSGNLVVMVTYDEGGKAGPVPGDGAVGENCANPNISPNATSCQAPAWIVGRYVPHYQYSSYMNHFGLLAAVQRILGLSPLLGHASDASTPDIVNGTRQAPNPFNLAASGTSTVGAPSAPSGQLLPDPGFETGTGGWLPFTQGTLTSVRNTVHGGTAALAVSATSMDIAPVGLTQDDVVTNSVAGAAYAAECYVQPTVSDLNVQIRFMEYTQNYDFGTVLQTTEVASLPANVWTLVSVSSVAANSGERVIPQIYSTNENASTGDLVYDDCSVTAG